MRPITLMAALIAAFAAPAFAQDCSSVTSATVAEIKAGEQQWDERAEALVRRAAGAACVKAKAEYAADMDAEPLANANGDQSENAAEPLADDADAEDGKAGWKFLGFDVNEAQGSPGQKPYSRKR